MRRRWRLRHGWRCPRWRHRGREGALVIGNGAYGRIQPLDNPVNDATLMGETLRGLGFEVAVSTDADLRDMNAAVRSFGKRLRAAGPGAVGLFFYAGHGVQSRGRNYLIPLVAPIDVEADLEFEAVRAQGVLGQMKDAGSGLNIVVLDACRSNPFPGSARSGARGLSRIDAPKGSLIAYSAPVPRRRACAQSDASRFRLHPVRC